MKAHFWAKATCLALALLIAETYSEAMGRIYQSVEVSLGYEEDY